NLAEQTGWSPATFSKFITIDERRERLTPYVSRLPSAWTVLYNLARLTDDQLSRLDKLRILRPSTRSRDISDFLTLKDTEIEAASPDGSSTELQPIGEPAALRELARIEVARELSLEATILIKPRLEEAVNGLPAH